MTAVMRSTRFEWQRMTLTRASLVMVVMLVLVQPLFSLIEGFSIAQIGIDAVPTPENGLVEPLAPLEFMGFDVFPFGEAVIVVIAALWGRLAFVDGELRTGFLAVGRRGTDVVGKLLAIIGLTIGVAFVSAYATVAAMQTALGSEGLNPLGLSSPTWGQIGKEVVWWVALAAGAYGLALITRGWIAPMVFFLPQVLGLLDWLGTDDGVGRFLPGSAGHCLVATPEVACSSSDGPAALIVITWTLGFVVLGAALLVRRDVGRA